MDHGTLALVFSGGLLAVHIIDRIWGGASGLASKFAKLEKDLIESIASLRKDLIEKHDNTSGNVGEAMRGLTQRMHELELGQAKFHAYIGENYMRRDSYYKAMEETKTEMRTGFDKLGKQVDDIRKEVVANMVENARR